MDALGVPPSAPALQTLRDLVADLNVAKKGSLLSSSSAGGGSSSRVKQAKNDIRLRDLEGWWFSAGAAAVTSVAGSANATMADLDGSGGTGILMAHAPESLSPEARKGLEAADVAALYLKLGISYVTPSPAAEWRCFCFCF